MSRGLLDMVWDGPVLSVEEGKALSNRICFPFTWGFRTAESTWWLFFFFFTLWYCFHGYFSTAGEQCHQRPETEAEDHSVSGRSGSIWSTLHNFFFGTVPSTTGDKPLDPSDQLPFPISNHTLSLYLDLAWIVSVQSKMFNHLGSGFNNFFSKMKCCWFTHKI